MYKWVEAMKTIGCSVLVLCAVLTGPAPASITADFELGAAWATRNDQAIPGTDGTRFSLVDDLSTPTLPVFRARLGWTVSDRQHVTALFAPLRATCRGTFDRDVYFNGEVFHAGRPVVGIYRFDSYRLTWRYRLIGKGNWAFWAGLTGKIRDAEVALVGETESAKTNTGFVPLINLHATYSPAGARAGFLFDADAAAAPQGRAEDVLVAFTYALREGLVGRVGYRFLEGGADVDEVYNFAFINYLVTGLEARF